MATDEAPDTGIRTWLSRITFGEAAAASAVLAALAFFLGAGIVLLRAHRADLPPSLLLTVTPRTEVISLGALYVLAPVTGFVGLAAVGATVGAFADRRRHRSGLPAMPRWRRDRFAYRAFGGAIVIFVVLLPPTLDAVPSFVATALLLWAFLGTMTGRWPLRAALVVMVLVTFLNAAVIEWGKPVFPAIAVVTTADGARHRGWYVGEASDATYLARPGEIQAIPGNQVRGTVVQTIDRRLGRSAAGRVWDWLTR